MTNTGPAAAPAPISSPMISAIERAWEAIRANHPELPHVVVIMGGGLVPGGIKLGHFAADRWAHREQGSENALDVGPAAAQTYSELFVGGEGLARQPHEVLATLLHEATHCLAHVRGIQDTSRQGRWHNRAFATLAAEMGITVTSQKGIGYSVTAIPDETVAAYMGTIMELELALTHIRTIPIAAKIVQPVTPAPVGGGVAVAPAPVRAKRPGALCGCGREVHIARAALAEAPIICGLCLTPFAYA